MVIAIVAVFAVVVFLARGRGGELSVERADYAPLDLGPVSATDVALLRPPTGLWGYSMQATDEAMDQIAESIRERDVRIVALEQLVTDLSRDHAPAMPLASPYQGARHRRLPGETGPMYQAQDFYGAADPESPMTQPAVAQPPWAPPSARQDPAAEASGPQSPATEPDEPAGDYAGPAPEGSAPPPERSHD
jgi:hypothetical protein